VVAKVESMAQEVQSMVRQCTVIQTNRNGGLKV
jgi:phosphate uptake regulator